MFRTEIRFDGDRESLADVIAAGIIEEFLGTSKKDIVERSKVIDEMDRYFGEVATRALHDGESPDFDKVLEAMRNFSELSKRIKNIK